MSKQEMTKEEIREEIVKIAQRWIGYIERPTNKTDFGEWYGLDGVPYCAIAVSYWYSMAGWGIGKIDTENGFHYCPTLYHRAKQKGWETNDPKKGDIVLFNFSGDILPEHTGIFIRWIDKKKGIFEAIEANTSPDEKGSQSNGGGVYLKSSRKMSQVSMFVNLIDNQK